MKNFIKGTFRRSIYSGEKGFVIGLIKVNETGRLISLFEIVHCGDDVVDEAEFSTFVGVEPAVSICGVLDFFYGSAGEINRRKQG